MRSNIIKTLVLTLTITLGVGVKAFADENGNWTKNRIYGQDRFETANKIADEFCKTNAELGLTLEYGKYLYPDCATTKVNTVILANGFNYPDALCSTPLSKALNAPVLLTHENNLTPSTANQIKKMGDKNVVIVGGEGVVTPNVENELKSMSLNISRLGGIDRYETSYLIAKEVAENIDIEGATVVSGLDWHDALIASPQASIENKPIFLVPIVDNPILPKFKELLESRGLQVRYTNMYGDSEKDLKPEILRKMLPACKTEGNDDVDFMTQEGSITNKYANSFYILDFQYMYALPYSVGENVFLTRGDDFADSLTVAPLAAKMSSPIVFGTTVNKCSKWDEFVDTAETESIKINYPQTPEGIRVMCNRALSKMTSSMRGIKLIGGETIVPDNAIDIFKGIWE